MPVYVCYRGDCDNFASLAPGPELFTAVDALGRTWLCRETGLDQLGAAPPPELGEMFAAQQLAHRHGNSQEGTSISWFDRPDEFALRRSLVLSTYPSFAESIVRLEHAGWIVVEYPIVNSPMGCLTVSNGRESRTFQGGDNNERCHKAAQSVLEPDSPAHKVNPMNMTIEALSVPLRCDEHGDYRVGKSRVLLDVIVEDFNSGADADSIARDYPSLRLADVYGVIAFYLENREMVDAYLRARQESAARLSQEIEKRQGSSAGLRDELLARRRKMEHATPGN